MKNNLIYKSSPLPFQGQKRGFLKLFTQSLKNFPENATYVDLFGGSGLLSRTVKDTYPNAHVVYNDFDGFSKRLSSINSTNVLLEKIRQILVHTPRNFKVASFDKDKIIKTVKAHKNTYGYLDLITLSASILFSGKYISTLAELEKQTFYNRVRINDIPLSKDYLKALDVVKIDYKDLFKHYKNKPNVVFLVDPPYLSTDTKSYSSNDYWKLKDYLDVLDVLVDTNYFYFTSNKSSLIELCEWMGEKYNANPFNKAIKLSVTNGVNYQHKYEDIMLFKTYLKAS